jgi:hypothetical protein
MSKDKNRPVVAKRALVSVSDTFAGSKKCLQSTQKGSMIMSNLVSKNCGALHT